MTWLEIPPEHPYGPQTLPYGVFSTRAQDRRRIGVAIGDWVLDLPQAAGELAPQHVELVAGASLDALLGAGRRLWDELREMVGSWLVEETCREAVTAALVPVSETVMHLPFTVADYVDFYASEAHATNLGRMFRPDQEPLPPNWKHLPVGYHGRAGTVVVSGTDIVRPHGQRRAADGTVGFGPSTRLDLEAEVGFVVGRPSALGESVGLGEFADHVFGLCLVNDWSARDLQAWEYVPLGPFLGKSFATTISPWIVPLAALDQARVRPPARSRRLLPYLDDEAAEVWGLDLTLEVRLNGALISRPPFAAMYWTGAQMLAHLSANGASVRTGDLYASGTVSGERADQRGSLIELCGGGAEPIELTDGSLRTFLEDGDEVVITATAPGPDGRTVGLGEVRGRIEAARSRGNG